MGQKANEEQVDLGELVSGMVQNSPSLFSWIGEFDGECELEIKLSNDSRYSGTSYTFEVSNKGFLVESLMIALKKVCGSEFKFSGLKEAYMAARKRDSYRDELERFDTLEWIYSGKQEYLNHQCQREYNAARVSISESEQAVFTSGPATVLLIAAYFMNNKDMQFLNHMTDEQKTTLSGRLGKLSELWGRQVDDKAYKEKLTDNMFEQMRKIYRDNALLGCHEYLVGKLEPIAQQAKDFVTTINLEPEEMVASIDGFFADFRALEPDQVFDTFESITEDYQFTRMRIERYLETSGVEAADIAALREKANRRGKQLYGGAGRELAELVSQCVGLDEEAISDIKQKLEEQKADYDASLRTITSDSGVAKVFTGFRKTLNTTLGEARTKIAEMAARRFHHTKDGVAEIEALCNDAMQVYDAARAAIITVPRYQKSLDPIKGNLDNVMKRFEKGEIGLPEAKSEIAKAQNGFGKVSQEARQQRSRVELMQKQYEEAHGKLDRGYHDCRDAVSKTKYEEQRGQLKQRWEKFCSGELSYDNLQRSVQAAHNQYDSIKMEAVTREREDGSLRDIISSISSTLKPLIDEGDDEVKEMAHGLVDEARSSYEAYRTGGATYKDAHAQVTKGLADANFFCDRLGVEQSQAGLNYYEVLGVEPTATAEEITSSYRRMVHIVHPDKVGDANGLADSAKGLFQMITAAHNVLSNDLSRRKYDQSIGIVR